MANEISSSKNPIEKTTINNVPSQPNTLISIKATTKIPFKLSKVNYAEWRAQFTNILFGHNLLGFLDGITPYLLKTILQYGSIMLISNFECKLWKCQDCLLLHTITHMSSCTLYLLYNNIT